MYNNNHKKHYCRTCGQVIDLNNYYCPNCGSLPFSGNNYCFDCGSELKNNNSVFCFYCKSENNLPQSFDAVKWQTLKRYYKRCFWDIIISNEERKGGFNICAFFFSNLWAISKGLYHQAFYSILLSICTLGIGGIIYMFIYGFRGNYMYYNKICKNISTLK